MPRFPASRSPHSAQPTVFKEALRISDEMEAKPLVRGGQQIVTIRSKSKAYNDAISFFIVYEYTNCLNVKIVSFLEQENSDTLVLCLPIAAGTEKLPVPEMKSNFQETYRKLIDMLQNTTLDIEVATEDDEKAPVRLYWVVSDPVVPTDIKAIVPMLDLLSVAHNQHYRCMGLAGNEEISQFMPQLPYPCILVPDTMRKRILERERPESPGLPGR